MLLVLNRAARTEISTSTAVTLVAGVVGLALLHEAVPSLLRPMFGSIPLAVQWPGALRCCLVASVASSVLLPEEMQDLSNLCFGLGTSLSLALVSARQVAKVSSQGGALSGALWASVGLMIMPTIFGAILCNRSAVGDSQHLRPFF